MQQGCFFFHYSLATSMTNWVKIFTDLLFYAYVGIHQVRILVFDNYQRCPVPLNLQNYPFPSKLGLDFPNSYCLRRRQIYRVFLGVRWGGRVLRQLKSSISTAHGPAVLLLDAVLAKYNFCSHANSHCVYIKIIKVVDITHGNIHPKNITHTRCTL